MLNTSIYALYKTPALIWIFLVQLAFSCQTEGTHSSGIKPAKLPPEVQEQKENYKLAFALAQEYPAKFITQVNNREERLSELFMLGSPGPINGRLELPLPPEFVRVASLFREMNIRGSGLKDVKVTWTGPSDTSSTGKVSDFWRSAQIIMGRPGDIKVKPGHYEGYTLILETNDAGASVSEIQLHQPAGISPVFDVTAWSVLGGDLPIIERSVTVNLSTQRSINGIEELEPEKFYRVYARPWGRPSEAYEAAQRYTQKGFLPGRQIFKLKEELEQAYGDAQAPKLKEDPERKGHADLSFFEENLQADAQMIENYKSLYPMRIDYALCLANWPTWMKPENLKGNQGTPAVRYFPAAAELAAAYIQALGVQTGGRLPRWVEVNNESTIRKNWAYHNLEGYDSWGLLADFHNIVADKIKAAEPSVLVGGPTSAWMVLDANNFAEAKNHLRFMDETKEHLDFYSHHFYEGKELILNRQEIPFSGFVTGRLSAVLDLLQNHMALTDNHKPIVISETGTLHSGPSDIEHWLKLKNYNSYMLQYMNRADEFDLIVPFLLPIMWWNKDAPDTLYRYATKKAAKKLAAATPQAYFLDFWKDYHGKLLPVDSGDQKIKTHAVLNGNTAYIVVNNLYPQRAFIDLKLLENKAKITSIRQTRMYLNLGKLHFETQKRKDLKDIPISVEETSIIQIRFATEPSLDKLEQEQTYYGNKTLQDTGKPVTFAVSNPIDQLQGGKLRISFGKENGFTQDMRVNVNGSEYEFDLEYSNKKGRFFSYIELELPLNQIRAQNTITVDIPESGGKISSVAITNRYLKL